MNHEFKTILIENENEYASKILDEIKNASDESELLRLLDKIISVQYYKGIYADPDEYDEIISAKINELIDINFKYSYSENEFKYFLKALLESYDLFLSLVTFNIEIDESIKIKSKYLIENLDSNFYLDEINTDYLDEIIVYASYDALTDYIDELIYLDSSNNNKDSFIYRYFNYDAYISDMIDSDELYELDYNYESVYISDLNLLY